MEKVKRSIWGFIYGDAFGVPVEFLARDTFSIQTLQGYGSWPVPAGTWSDDSAMMFVTMDHLIRNTSIDDLKRAFCDWKYRGFWTFDHEPSFDVGITISEVLERWEHISLNEQAKSDEHSNGNGALMRILPIAFYSYNMPEEQVNELIRDYASLTHGHIRSTLCSIHYCKVVHALLDGKDTDTIAALTGGLAGLMYDELNIPDDWPNQIPRRNDIEQLIAEFSHIVK